MRCSCCLRRGVSARSRPASSRYARSTARALIVALFYNDAPTRLAVPIAILAVGVVALARKIASAWPVAAGIAAIAVAANALAAAHPVDFYADALRVRARSTGVYAWLASSHPSAIGGWGLALGSANVLSPGTRTVDLPDERACAFALRDGLLLVALAEEGRSDAFNAARLAAARRCGSVRYDDGLAIVVAPAPPR